MTKMRRAEVKLIIITSNEKKMENGIHCIPILKTRVDLIQNIPFLEGQ